MTAFTVSDYAVGLVEIADREDLERAFFYVAKFYLENSENLQEELSRPSGELIERILSTVSA